MAVNKKCGIISAAVVTGFTLFAVFFGAGNLIFPPFLGREAGHDWMKGFLCFVTADAGLAIITVLATVRSSGTMEQMLEPLGKIQARLLSLILMLCIGPLVAIPRTGATTYELAVHPLIPGIPAWAFSLLFFGTVALLTIRPASVVDIIGRFLTPVLLLALALLCVKGILSPIGERGEGLEGYNVSKTGFLTGYQTMDALGGIPVAVIILKSVKQKGFESKQGQMRVMLLASAVAFAGLFLVYGGLCYLGATSSRLELGDITQTELLVLITEMLLKRLGVVLLGLIVLFACLTTAVGLTASAADYFSGLLKGKLSYGRLVLVICAAAVAISNIGIRMIVQLASPVLSVIFPVFLTQIFLSFCPEKIRRKAVCRGAALAALIVSVLDAVSDLGAKIPVVDALPLASDGFAWLVPALIGGLIGLAADEAGKRKRPESGLSGGPGDTEG